MSKPDYNLTIEEDPVTGEPHIHYDYPPKDELRVLWDAFIAELRTKQVDELVIRNVADTAWTRTMARLKTGPSEGTIALKT